MNRRQFLALGAVATGTVALASIGRSRRSHHMSGHRLGRTNWHVIGMISEARLNGMCLCSIVVQGRRAMCIDVINLIGT